MIREPSKEELNLFRDQVSELIGIWSQRLTTPGSHPELDGLSVFNSLKRFAEAEINNLASKLYTEERATQADIALALHMTSPAAKKRIKGARSTDDIFEIPVSETMQSVILELSRLVSGSWIGILELAHKSGIDRGNVSAALYKLEAKGWIESQIDGRSRLSRITDLGRNECQSY